MSESPPFGNQILASQVGGHAGVMTTEDGSLLIKPSLPGELAFYIALQQNPALDGLRLFTPQFLGTLRLEGQVDPMAELDLAKVASGNNTGVKLEPVPEVENKESIVLENLSYPFIKPNILDIKLGTVLYDDFASEEKKQRMEKTARETTSFETGVRLTGFQVYENVTGLPVNTPKSYGKSIKPAQLTEGISKFFPIGRIPLPPRSHPPLKEDAYSASQASSTSQGLPAHTLLPILQAIRAEIAEIHEVYAALEIRMVGGSLLVLYEADWERAEEGVEKFLIDDEDEDEADEEEESSDDDDEEEEDKEDEGGETRKKKVGPPYAVKLIDFAHARLAPGEGPDESVLKGLDTVLQLLDGRIGEVDKALVE